MHGAIFTRGPKDLHNTAIFIGGTDMAAGERLLAAVRKAFFGPMRVSVMLDSNGSNTTAVAAVAKVGASRRQARLEGRPRAVVTAGTGPVGMRAAGLLAKAGADVVLTSRRPEQGTQVIEGLRQRFGGAVRVVTMSDSSQAAAVVASTGAPSCSSTPVRPALSLPARCLGGARRAARRRRSQRRPAAWRGRIEVTDDGVEREGVTAFGALGVGKLKMKIHKACIARLFEQNDLVLDAETIAEVARALSPQPKGLEPSRPGKVRFPLLGGQRPCRE